MTLRRRRAAAIFSAVALGLGLLLLRQCSALPPLENRTVSTARLDTGSTVLGKAVAPLTAAHPGVSGTHPMRDARDAFAARFLLARAAERTLDVQYEKEVPAESREIGEERLQGPYLSGVIHALFKAGLGRRRKRDWKVRTVTSTREPVSGMNRVCLMPLKETENASRITTCQMLKRERVCLFPGATARSSPPQGAGGESGSTSRLRSFGGLGAHRDLAGSFGCLASNRPAAELVASDWPDCLLGGSGSEKRCGPAKGECSLLPIFRI